MAIIDELGNHPVKGGKKMLFKVMVVAKTGTVTKHISPAGTLVPRNTHVLPGTVLEVYGYANSEETRFVCWNEQLSAAFFTVAINDCRPAY